jgi:signal-transduction protein with cAMP-binding, CBS, and nucleotidyltransferase domain
VQATHPHPDARPTAEAVGDVLVRDALVIGPDAPIAEAARRLYLDGVGLLVVGTREHPVGVLSERDVVQAVARGLDPASTPVRLVMTAAMVVADLDESLLDAALQMLDAGVRHLPVELDGRVEGVISVRDVLRPLVFEALLAESG